MGTTLKQGVGAEGANSEGAIVMMSPVDERRVARRAVVRLPIELAVDDGESRGHWVTSLSTTGVFVVGDDTPSLGSRVSLSWPMSGSAAAWV